MGGGRGRRAGRGGGGGAAACSAAVGLGVFNARLLAGGAWSFFTHTAYATEVLRLRGQHAHTHEHACVAQVYHDGGAPEVVVMQGDCLVLAIGHKLHFCRQQR